MSFPLLAQFLVPLLSSSNLCMVAISFMKTGIPICTFILYFLDNIYF